MNKMIGVQLVGYSGLLAGLGYLARHLAPADSSLVTICGFAGGSLCFIWGLRAIAGNRGKALALLTLIGISFVMLSQTVLSWGSASKEISGQTAASAVITVLLVLSVVMLMRVAYAGVIFAEPVATPKKGQLPTARS